MLQPFDLLFFLLISTREDQKLAIVAEKTIIKCGQVLKIHKIVTENRSYPSSPKVGESMYVGTVHTVLMISLQFWSLIILVPPVA